MRKEHLISIIIPAYKEEKNIKKTIMALEKGARDFIYPTEIVVVCDGFLDKTFEIAEETRKLVNPKTIRVFGYEKNHGKGYALRYGSERSTGDIIAFFDAGLDFSPDHINKFVELMDVFDAHIVIGSKRHPASQVTGFPKMRRVYSKVYQIVNKVLFNLNIQDTQVGIKVFRRDVLLKIFPYILGKKYAFDIELLVAAKKQGFNKVFEAPVHLELNLAGGTGINAKAIREIISDTLAVFYRKHFLHWYDKPKRK